MTYLDKLEEGYQGEALKIKCREEEDEGCEERRVRNEIIKAVIKGVHKKVIDESVENEGKRTGGPDLMRSWVCSQIENEERRKAGKKGTKWQSSGRKEQTLEEIVERRSIEGSS